MALNCIVLSWEVGCLKYSCLLPALDNLASFTRPLCFQLIVEKIEGSGKHATYLDISAAPVMVTRYEPLP